MYDEETRRIAILEVGSRGGDVAAAARALGLRRETVGRRASAPPREGRKPAVCLPYEGKRRLVERLSAGERAADPAGGPA